MKSKTLLQITTLFLLQCMLVTGIYAQSVPPPKQWDKRFGGSLYDGLSEFLQTNDRGYILGGSSYSGISSDKTEPSRGGYDYWVIKTDANGKKQWDKTFGGSGNDYLNSIDKTTDGGYVLAGNSYSGADGDKTETGRGGGDYWVVKIDANGVKQWDKRFGGAGDDYIERVLQTTDGGYIMGGFSYSDAGGDRTEATRGGQDYWVVKIDANGVKQWDKRFGGTLDERLYALRQTSDGGYILGGWSLSGITGDKSEANKGDGDYWIVKIDAGGIKQWDKSYGGTGGESITDVQQTTDGGYVLGGFTGSGQGGDKSQGSRGGYDYWIIKTDDNGAKQWDKRFGGNGDDSFWALQQTTDGGYILGGSSYSGAYGDKSEASRGSLDYWIVKIGPEGGLKWDKTFGGHGSDDLSFLVQTDDGGFALGGTSHSGRDGDKTQKSRGLEDFWIIKMTCTPIAEITVQGNLDICTTGSVVLTATDTYGYKYTWLKNNVAIPGANKRSYTATTPGIYKVKIHTNGGDCIKYSKGDTVINSCAKYSTAGNVASATANSTLISLLITPNPSKGNIVVSQNCYTGGVMQLNVFDITGKKLMVKTVQAVAGNNVYHLNLSMLSACVYYLEINNNTTKQQTKFVIER